MFQCALCALLVGHFYSAIEMAFANIYSNMFYLYVELEHIAISMAFVEFNATPQRFVDTKSPRSQIDICCIDPDYPT